MPISLLRIDADYADAAVFLRRDFLMMDYFRQAADSRRFS